MSRSFKIFGGLVLLVAVLTGGLYAYRSLMFFEGRTPEGYKLLTAVPAAAGFEPANLPKLPVLENEAAAPELGVAFGYRVGHISYSYTMRLAFPDGGPTGKATVTVHHATREASAQTSVVRRWDAPRNAYAVALEDRFDIHPAVPALCIKAVIGPQSSSFDLKDASICVAQRDVTGTCRPETLACGLIR